MRLRRFLAGGLVVGIVSAVAVLSASARDTQVSPAPAFSAADLMATPSANWIGWNGSLFNQRYSALNQVSIDNVSQLKLAWKGKMVIPGLHQKHGLLGLNNEGSPIAYGGNVYIPDGNFNVYAFNGATGERLWSFHPKYPHGGSQAPIAISLRGVAIGDGKIYVPLADSSIAALDQGSGRVLWRTTVANWRNGYSFTNAPTYYNGMILTGETGGDSGADCQVIALSAKTGKVLWRFHVVPSKPGQPGYSSWPLHRAWVGGGAMWNTPAIDPALGLLYVGVGNPVPYTGVVRGPGKELFTESIVALHLNSGKLAWGYQEVHHDIWDYDTTNPIILYDLSYKGKLRHALVQANKNGWLYILDRATGKPIIGIPEKKVPQDRAAHTYATQPIPIGQPFAKQCPSKAAWAKFKAPDGKPYIVGCTYQPYDTTRYTVTAPSPLGGADWPASSYSPQTGYMYICSKNSETINKSAAESDIKLQKLGNFSQLANVPPALQKKTPAAKTVGTLVAMNLRTNRVAWMRKWRNDICYSGTATTAGGLVFVGRNTGRLQAYDAKNGTLVWTSPKLSGGADAAPMVYEANGKEYISVYAGGNSLVSFAGIAPHVGSYLYTFALPS